MFLLVEYALENTIFHNPTRILIGAITYRLHLIGPTI